MGVFYCKLTNFKTRQHALIFDLTALPCKKCKGERYIHQRCKVEGSCMRDCHGNVGSRTAFGISPEEEAGCYPVMSVATLQRWCSLLLRSPGITTKHFLFSGLQRPREELLFWLVSHPFDRPDSQQLKTLRHDLGDRVAEQHTRLVYSDQLLGLWIGVRHVAHGVERGKMRTQIIQVLTQVVGAQLRQTLLHNLDQNTGKNQEKCTQQHARWGLCALRNGILSTFQWKPFWLATQRDPQNDWTATQNRVNYDVFAQAPLSSITFQSQLMRS